MWVAGPRFVGPVGDERQEGDPVPEANDWKHIRMWENAKHVRWVPDAEPPSKKSPVVDSVSVVVVDEPKGPVPLELMATDTEVPAPEPPPEVKKPTKVGRKKGPAKKEPAAKPRRPRGRSLEGS